GGNAVHGPRSRALAPMGWGGLSDLGGNAVHGPRSRALAPMGWGGLSDLGGNAVHGLRSRALGWGRLMCAAMPAPGKIERRMGVLTVLTGKARQ
ncbi:hypothetical protein, partial [Nocardia sp. NPDC052316]|uniref:hypothetical protein n=1 Tax=Nocardia sp. NPDC052316 TaxID=3364329 RepID=UPI0037CC2580